jgi:lipopolysaccharide biosynthesis glycosyltransferase
MLRLFVGYDPREAVAYHVFVQSVLDRTSVPVSITPLHAPMLAGFDGQRDGTNAFIFSRYLIPALCGFKGWALFVDGDMLLRADLADLWALRDEGCAVQVVKHDYQTRHPRKYLGSPLENDNVDYPRKNWSSVVLWNCAHPSNAVLTREFVEDVGGAFLHRFMWLKDAEIGPLPAQWNALIGEQYCPDAKLAHYTLGVPGFKRYRQEQHACGWALTYLRAMHLLGESPNELTHWATEATCG